MANTSKLHKLQGKRLQKIREAAGFGSMRSAALGCDWPESTYKAHEKGTRTIGQDDAMRYVAGFSRRGAKGFTAKWLLFGDELDLNELLRSLPADVAIRAYEAAIAEIEKDE